MSNIHFIQLADYQAPKISENKRDEWVDFGEDNNYYQFLIDRYNGSTTNNAVINNITKLIYGKGLTANDASKKPNEYAQMKMLFSKDTLRKITKDLKLLGEFNLQLIYNEKKDKIVRVEHLPTNLVRSEKCNKDGLVEAIYYCDNWQDTKKFQPKRLPLFGYGTKGDKLEVLRVGNYTIGQKYYSNIDWIGATSYATLEQEISDYLINDVQRGFSSRAIINFNNGVPTEEQQQIISSKVKKQYTGSKGDPVIIAFNSDETKKTTIDSVPLDNAPELYKYLSDECLAKIMLAHNVTSPLLFGIATSTGFSANADELRNSYILFENMVIQPFQDTICDAIDKILAYNEISLDLKFIQLQPLDSEGDLTSETDTVISSVNSLSPLVANKVLESMTANEIRSLVGLKPTLGGSDLNPNTLMSSHTCLSKDLTDAEGNNILELLQGESVTDEWELVDKREYSDSNNSIEEWAKSKIKDKQNLLQKFAGVIKSAPSKKSSLDKENYKVRYEYFEKYSSNNSRDFCKQMMRRTANGVVYRKEDIDEASFQGVNIEFGHNGQNYSLFKFKGGVNCSHVWNENLYRLKTKTDGTPYIDKALSSSEEVASIDGYNPNPSGWDQAQIAPIDMPNRGHHPNYKQ
jgi:hypothetical protein